MRLPLLVVPAALLAACSTPSPSSAPPPSPAPPAPARASPARIPRTTPPAPPAGAAVDPTPKPTGEAAEEPLPLRGQKTPKRVHLASATCPGNVPLVGLPAALAAGYLPCPRCRPDRVYLRRTLARNSHQPSAAAADSTASSRPSPSSRPRRTASATAAASGAKAANLRHSPPPRDDVGEKSGLGPPPPPPELRPSPDRACTRDDECTLLPPAPCGCPPCSYNWLEPANRKHAQWLQNEYAREQCAPMECTPCKNPTLGRLDLNLSARVTCQTGQCTLVP